MAIQRLETKQLYHAAELEKLPCKSTKELPPIDEIVGQERAQKAVEFAMSIKEKGYNIYAIGQNGLGKRTMILRYLSRHPHDSSDLYDWCYVANFADTRTPKVLKLPCGVGERLKKDVEKLILKLVKAIPMAFDNELYFGRADKLKNDLAKKQQVELQKLSEEAKEKGISLTITPQGDYQFVAMNEEELHTEESFAELPDDEQERFGLTIDELEVSLRGMARELTDWEETYTDNIQKLNEEVTLGVISHLIKKLKKEYNGYTEIKKNVQHWSQNFFGINDSGDVTVSPRKDGQHHVPLTRIAQALEEKGLTLPALVRFPQIIHQRVHGICDAFNQAINDYGYNNEYLLVYPIKVNQQKDVVEQILASQAEAETKQLGLEAGSKPELMAVLAMAQRASSVIVCNGYKDREYVRLALIGEKLGHKVFIVLEKLSELDIVLKEAKALNVKPRVGLRIRLASQGAGKWQASGGEKSKFGLSASQVLQVVERLKAEDQLEMLQLVHFHLGSQMANIRDVRNGVNEAARFYCELRKMSVPIAYFDVGGGLAVDYDGTRSQSSSSMNYGLAEYARNIVSTVGDVCALYEESAPVIISESGRSLTAHHAVLITNVIGTESYNVETVDAPSEDAPLLLQNMWQNWQNLRAGTDARALIEIYNDTQSDLSEAQTLFTSGVVDLHQRAWVEQLSLSIYGELHKQMDNKNRFHRPILDELSERLADKFFVNFSLFQSLPDAWGIEQVFPVLPLSGLGSEEQTRAVMLDITCDSDGAVDQYVDGQGIESTLPVPAWNKDQPYLMGFFLVGAYQEILGDMHNLFGDTHSAVVNVTDNGDFEFAAIDLGDTVEDMMRYVHIDVEAIKNNYKELVEKHIEADEQALILEELEYGLTGYTYLEDF